MVALMEIYSKIEQLEKEEKFQKEQLEREEKLRIEQLEKEEKLKRLEMEQEIERIKLFARSKFRI